MVAIYAQQMFASLRKPPEMKYWKYYPQTRALRSVKWSCELELKKIPDWLELVDWIFYLHSQGIESSALDELITFCGWYFGSCRKREYLR